MINIEALERYAHDHQRQLLDEAARSRLLRRGSTDATRSPLPSMRARIATMLRQTADRLEPAPSQARIGVLRAVAHREISVEQGLRLLEANGHRSFMI